jgi:hypothetical protein
MDLVMRAISFYMSMGLTIFMPFSFLLSDLSAVTSDKPLTLAVAQITESGIFIPVRFRYSIA